MSQEPEERSLLSEPKKRKKYVYLDKFEQYKKEMGVLYMDVIKEGITVRRIATAALVTAVTSLSALLVYVLTK
jgi:hypothetical protein